MKQAILAALDEHKALFAALDALTDNLEAAARLVSESVRQGGRLVLFGNGGSAADAQHIAAELVGRFERERKAIPALALTVNTSVLTSLANDYDFTCVFARQVEALVGPKDTIIAISTSGKSSNVVEGARQARLLGAKVIALTGADPGPLGREATICLAIPSRRTARIQEGHIFVGHVLCQLVEEAGAGPEAG